MGPEERQAWLRSLIGRRVRIDSSGNMGLIVSVDVTSDGFVTGRTLPGYDQGVFIGRAPWAVPIAEERPITSQRAEPPDPSYRPITRR